MKKNTYLFDLLMHIPLQFSVYQLMYLSLQMHTNKTPNYALCD